MSFISLSYLLFLPVICLLYYIIPHKLRWALLLVGSYFFYMSWNIKYALLMLLSTVITYGSGLLIKKYRERERERERASKSKWNYPKLILWFSLLSNLGILFFYKYFNFVNTSFSKFFEAIHFSWGFENLNILLPVGISFYTFQALSYSLDVYHGKTEVTNHFGKYALFVSFFPQLVAGPIERSYQLLPQFDKRVTFDYDRIKDGLGLVLWGVFKKVVIANRLAVVVNTVYENPSNYLGFELVIATIFFAFQIYTDFSAYTDIARGSARILGFELMKNFKQPYFATSIPDFWRKWHISLTTWFRDYVYIPLGGNRVSKTRWYINIMIVFLVSGLWHGAAWNFLIWGFLHGIFQLIDLQTKSFRIKSNVYLNIDATKFDIKIFKTLWTFILVCFAWIFFRAESFDKAIDIVLLSANFNPWVLFDGSLYNLGLDSKDFNLSILLILLLLSFWKMEQHFSIRKQLQRQHFIFRQLAYASFIITIVVFGFYGVNYDASQFIYFQF